MRKKGNKILEGTAKITSEEIVEVKLAVFLPRNEWIVLMGFSIGFVPYKTFFLKDPDDGGKLYCRQA